MSDFTSHFRKAAILTGFYGATFRKSNQFSFRNGDIKIEASQTLAHFVSHTPLAFEH